MHDYICIIFIILLILLLTYSFIKSFIREGLSLKDIKNAISKVGSLGKDISKLSGNLSNEIRKVGNLGKDIKNLGKEIDKMAKYPEKFGKDLGNEITKVSKEAGGLIKKEFDKAVDEVEDAAKDVENFAKKAIDDIKKEIDKIVKTIDKIPGQVTKLANEIFLDKIPKLFKEGWNQFKKHVLDPIVKFFDHVGEVFKRIGDVFVEIFNSLIKIPQCIPYYAMDAGYEMGMATLKTVTPKWIKDIVRWIYRNIIETIVIPVIKFFLWIIQSIFELFGFDFNLDGFGDDRKKCYDFGPLDDVIKAIKEFFEEVFKGVEDLFKMIPFDQIIKDIMKVFTPKKK